jgi:hypothetical protein
MEPVLPVEAVEYDKAVDETGIFYYSFCPMEIYGYITVGDVSNFTAEQYLSWVR